MANPVAVIGGTGFETALQESIGADGTPLVESVPTQYGQAENTWIASGGNPIAFLPRHGPGHTVPPHRINHRANIAALHQLGVQSVFSTAAVGSLRLEYKPGDLAVCDDFMDLRVGAPTTFFDESPVVHTDFTEPFSTRLRNLLLQNLEPSAADARGGSDAIIHPRATYLCLDGPRFETPAEVRCFGSWGCDLVGMTVAAEAILARELGMEYASVAVVTNFGTGLSATPLFHGEVEQMMRERRPTVVAMLLRAIGLSG